MPDIELVNPSIEQYAERFTTPEPAALKEINEQTIAHHAHAHMLSSQR